MHDDMATNAVLDQETKSQKIAQICSTVRPVADHSFIDSFGRQGVRLIFVLRP